MKNKRHTLLGITCLSALMLPCQSAVLGTSDASHPVFDDGWQTGDDGDVSGNAFNGWFLSTTTTATGFAGHFIGNSINTGADINSGGESFVMFAGGGGAEGAVGQADAYGFFNGALTEGQTFTIDLAVNFRNGFKGIDLRNDGNDAVIFNFNIGGDDYTVNSATTGNGTIGNDYSDNSAFHLAFTQSTAGGGIWAITRSGGISDFDTGTYTGVPSSFKLYIGQTDGGDANNLVANNLSIVPEPTVALLGGLGLLTLLRRRR